ncbi:MotA/TolQ/ExbB proton channel family protein [Paenibacillus sp. PFR10]|uniref:MotA/TolQ/ExbB proton channel family protein n=1 Tax=Paenibacillus violae TaxID=3077234 RepID=A0ABU3RNH2_9BACL|nr:MotA/TolQ/ExbB proton channel family protein [Paenibacillus sp. PFR10]MDU0205826.1 MotA/TolQ/ExbB proton channel family protein [Paenibacillus sp. PFR10]
MHSFKVVWIAIQVIVFLGAAISLGLLIKREYKIMKNILPDLQSLNKSQSSSDLDQEVNGILHKANPKSKYSIQWRRYYERVTQKNIDERIRIEPYLSSDVLVYHIGYRAWTDVIGGLCVSLGVLGTFIGLVSGLSHLDLNSTDSLKTSIHSLLSGMESAFYTSIVGIALSVIWTVMDRVVSGRVESMIDMHAERFDFLLNADDEELFLNRLEKVSRNQADHLKTLLTDALEKAIQPIANQIQRSQAQVASSFDQLHEQFHGFRTGIQDQTKLLEKQVQHVQNQSSDITKNLVDQITGGTEQTIQQFSQLIQETQSMQSHMLKTVEQMVESFKKTEQRHAVALNQFGQMTDQFEKVVSGSEQMYSNFSQVVDNIATLQDQLTEMQGIQQKLLPELKELRSQTNDVVIGTLEKSEYYLNRVEHQITQMQNHWQDTNEQMKATREVLHVSVKDFAENIDSGLGKTYSHFDNTLAKAMQNLSGSVNRIQEIQEELIDTFEELADIISQSKEVSVL